MEGQVAQRAPGRRRQELGPGLGLYRHCRRAQYPGDLRCLRRPRISARRGPGPGAQAGGRPRMTALFAHSIYWDLPILIVVVSLVYSATRFDRWDHIAREAFRW